jgi:hypothetical protein
MKMQLQIPLEYGLLFLSDPYAEDQVPPDTGVASVTYTDTCIALQVPAYVEGEADITLSDAEFTDQGHRIFSGTLRIPSQVISLSDPNRFNYLMLPIDQPFCLVTVWQYWEDANRKLWITLSNIALFSVSDNRCAPKETH